MLKIAVLKKRFLKVSAFTLLGVLFMSGCGDTKKTDPANLLSGLNEWILKTVLENNEMGDGIGAADIVIDQICYGSFSQPDAKEALVTCKFLNTSHVGGLDRTACIILSVDSMEMVAYQELGADEVRVYSLPMSNGQDRIFFSGTTAYQGISTQEILLFSLQAGQWVEIPIDALETLGDECFYFPADDVMLAASGPELTDPSEVKAILTWDPDTGQFSEHINVAMDDCPIYFAPIVQELESAGDEAAFVMNRWWDKGLDWSEEYADKTYTCTIEENTHVFSLEEELSGAEQWYWQGAGVFCTEGKTSICLRDFNIMYDENTVQAPQLLLLEFSDENPAEYEVTPYEVDPADLFGWDVECYRIGDNIYLAGETALAAVNLQTKQFSYCREEYAQAREYVMQKNNGEPYEIFLFRAVLEKDGVVVYSAKLAQDIDMPPTGMIYIACRDGKAIAYMTVELTEDNGAGSIEIQVQ